MKIDLPFLIVLNFAGKKCITRKVYQATINAKYKYYFLEAKVYLKKLALNILQVILKKVTKDSHNALCTVFLFFTMQQ